MLVKLETVSLFNTVLVVTSDKYPGYVRQPDGRPLPVQRVIKLQQQLCKWLV